MKNVQRLTLTAVLAGAALLMTGCNGNAPQAPAASPDIASPAVSASATPVPTTVAPKLGAGIISKGVANDGKGVYLQTSIADTDPAMKYNPAFADAPAKEHYSAEELAEAQKVIVKFIAEEVIDSTLNGGGKDVDGWYAAHKDQIHPTNQPILLAALKEGKDPIERELWMATKPGYSFAHGVNTPRVTARTITPTKLRFVENGALQGVMLDTSTSYQAMVTKDGAHSGVQSTSGTVSVAVAKDPADGKWKIAGIWPDFTTTEG